MKISLFLVSLMFCIYLAAGFANAFTITYQITDLPDVNPGEDLWQYTYRITESSWYYVDPSYPNYHIYNDVDIWISFEPGPDYCDVGCIYDNVEPLSVNSDWEVVAEQNNNNAFGVIYTALTDNPSLADPFKVNFLWYGSGLPSPQDYALFHYVQPERCTEGCYYNTTVPATSGSTVPVPEPASLLLISGGIVGLGVLRKRYLGK